MPEIREFDVRSLNATVNARKPWNRLYMMGLIVFTVGLFFAALLLWSRAGFELAGDPRWIFLVLATAVFAGLVIRLGVVSRRVDYPTAQRITVQSDGVYIQYPTTEVRAFRWKDDRMSFELLEYDWAATRALGSISPTRFTLIADGRLTVIDESAYRAILTEAESRGLTRPKAPSHLTIGNPRITLVQGHI